jgi:hypothetical protein
LYLEICKKIKIMDENRGKILSDVLHDHSVRTGISLVRLAKAAGYDQSTMYRHFKEPQLKSGILWRYGNAIEYDFRKDIVALDQELGYLSESESSQATKPKLANQYFNELVAERDEWRDRYIDLLEKHNAVLQGQTSPVKS